MIDWLPTPPAPSLHASAIHVWRLPASAPADALDWLDDTEHARLAAMADDTGRERLLATRAGLRQVLAGYLGCTPACVSLRIAEGGKPALVDGPQFNLSHTGDLALLAVADFAVGIDVERRRSVARAPSIARRVLDADTVQTLAQLSGSQRDAAFLAAWTAMEARQKCLGHGVFGRRVKGADVGNLAVMPDNDHFAHLAWGDPQLNPDIQWYRLPS